MNTKKILSTVLGGLFGLGLSADALSFANDDDTQNPSVAIGESCSMSTSTAAAVTQDNLESGVTDNTAIFGTVTTSCNSADGFKYQIKADGPTCVFKHATLDNSVTYSINTTTPAVTNSASGVVAGLGDGCPDDTAGYVNIWSVAAGSVHQANTLSLQTTITAAGVGELPEGTYSESLVIRLSDTAAA